MKLKKALGTVLLFVIVFLFGWESASYYIVNSTGAQEEMEVSPVNAFSSLIAAPRQEVSGARANLETFWAAWDVIFARYVDETVLSEQDLVYGAIKGMVAAIGDPYTVYMTPDETVEFDNSLNGQLEGIGAELTVRDQALVVVTPLKGSPAEAAGLKPGDIVYKIDGALTAEMTLFQAIMSIRGEKGSQVVLTILRQGVEQPFDVEIVRERIHIESVAMETVAEDIYLMSVFQFGDSTTAEFEKKIQELLLKEPKGLIMDLRNNGGGYLEISVDMLSELIRGQLEAVTIKRRDQSENETLHLRGDPALPEVPLVVLINEGSASAAEILAGAIQDHKRGIVMGTQSFGKGSVQEVDKLQDGSSLRITIAQWFTPNGNNIDEVGITPDIVVEFSEVDYAEDRDPQLDAAVEYLLNL